MTPIFERILFLVLVLMVGYAGWWLGQTGTNRAEPTNSPEVPRVARPHLPAPAIHPLPPAAPRAPTDRCDSIPPQRSEKPAFKGMELYSFKPTGKDWHFSLLPGTNRLTPIEIIKGTAIVGLPHLKPKLAELAKGEIVSWKNLAEEPVPQQVVNELTAFCSENQTSLTLIETHNKSVQATK